MNRKHISGLTQALITIAFLAVFAGAGAAESQSVLDPAQHPKSPEYQTGFSGAMAPLDSKLSWTQRFNGDETFNAEVGPLLNSEMTTNTSNQMITMKSESMVGMKMDGVGVIKGLQLAQSKIKISHGTIDKYGMPAMTMVFKVEDPAMFEGLEKNQEIRFDVDNSSGGFVVTHIMPVVVMGDASSQQTLTTMDVRGVVQTIRESQGKVKIKHGPIEKYGMPGMTMMFKVADPALLNGLQKGAQVDFNVDNSSGGFVITDIAPVAE